MTTERPARPRYRQILILILDLSIICCVFSDSYITFCLSMLIWECSIYPTTNLFVFFKYLAGIEVSRRQVIFIGFSPSCLT